MNENSRLFLVVYSKTNFQFCGGNRQIVNLAHACYALILDKVDNPQAAFLVVCDPSINEL